MERIVKVVLSAQVDEYVRNFKKAKDAVQENASESEKLRIKLDATRQAYEATGRGAVVAGGLIAAGVALAIAKFADFDQAMSNVQAATGESTANMGLLRQAAIDAGASTVYSATEAAGAIEELAKAGVSTADILSGGLAGSLDLAAAGQLDVARAAEITSTALNQFGLSGDQASHVADVLAAGAGKAMGSVDDLAQGLKFVGPVAASMGVSLEETTGALALFAQQGIIGEQAGTSLRGVLSSLTSPSSQARTEIERLGITLYDSQGNFLGLENAAGQLATAYRGMDGASRDASLGIIFGRETVTAATALYQAGAEGVDEWTTAVDDSGYAAEQARMRLDNLKGDIEALGGALDSALIETGSGANDVLRDMVQTLTGLVGMYGDLPPGVQQATLAIAGGTAAVLLAGGTAIAAVPKFLELRSAFQAAGLSMSGMALKAGVAGLALGGLFAIVGELARSHAEARQKAESYADTLEDGARRVTKATRDMVKENLAAENSFLWMGQGSAYDNAEALGISLDLVTDAAMGQAEAIRQLQGELELAKDNHDGLGLSAQSAALFADRLSTSVQGEASSLDEALRIAEQKDRVTEKGTASTEKSTKATQTAVTAYEDEASAVTSARDALEKLLGLIDEANGRGQDAASAQIDYRNALAQVDETIQKANDGVEGYTATLDINTQAGRDNRDLLIGLAQSAQDAAEKQFQLDGNTQNYRASLEAGRQSVIDRATALGMNADEAGRFADEIYRIPTEKEWKAIADTADAQSKAERLSAAISGIRDRTVTIRFNYPDGKPLTDAQIADQVGSSIGVSFRANGGPIFGPGGPTDDRIPAMLSNGEHVWTAAEVAAAGGHGVMQAWRALALGQGAPRYAEGGAVYIDQRPQYLAASPLYADTRPVLMQPWAAAPADQRPITQNVYPAPGMSETEVARIAGERISFALRGA